MIGARLTQPESSVEAASSSPVPIGGPRIQPKMRPTMLPLHAKKKPAEPPAVLTPKPEPLSNTNPRAGLFRCMYKTAPAPKARPVGERQDSQKKTAEEDTEEIIVVEESAEETEWAKKGIPQPPVWIGPPPKAWWPAKPPPPPKKNTNAGVGLIYAMHV